MERPITRQTASSCVILLLSSIVGVGAVLMVSDKDLQ